MKTATSNGIRTGNFTSSEIVALMSNGKAKDTLGKPALTYIEECNMERRLDRSLDTESGARPLSWGKLVESRVFDLLGTEYQFVASESIMHPVHNFWAGSPDANKFDEGKTVVDIKSPITLKSFCQLVAPLYMDHAGKVLDGMTAINHVRENHKDGEKYYWQLVSNSILTDSKYAELIIYVPYRSELQAIRDMAAMIDDEKQKNYFWINNASDDELPWLKEGGYYKNINTIRFEVSVQDKDALTERVKICAELLNKIL